MRLAEVTADAWLSEVGAEHFLTGRFDGGTGDAGESTLSFVTEAGHTFKVANNPAGATTVGCTIRALAYPVRLVPQIARDPQRYLCVICPRSYADLWGLRSRLNAGLPCGVYVDAESGQLRHRRAPAAPSASADG